MIELVAKIIEVRLDNGPALLEEFSMKPPQHQFLLMKIDLPRRTNPHCLQEDEAYQIY
jgi:hypothetical protein